MTQSHLSIVSAILLSIGVAMPQSQAQLTDERLDAIQADLDREFGGFDELLRTMIHQERVSLRLSEGSRENRDPRPQMRILTARGNVFSPRAMAKTFADRIGADFVFIDLTQFAGRYEFIADSNARNEFVGAVESYLKGMLLTPLLSKEAENPSKKIFFYVDGIDQIPAPAAQILHSLLRGVKVQALLNVDAPPGEEGAATEPPPPVMHTFDFRRFHFLVTATGAAEEIDRHFGLANVLGLRQQLNHLRVNRELVLAELDRNGYPHASQQLYQAVVVGTPPEREEFGALIEVLAKRLVSEVGAQLRVRVQKIADLGPFSEQVAKQFYGPSLHFESLARDFRSYLERLILPYKAGSTVANLHLDAEDFIEFVRTGTCQAFLVSSPSAVQAQTGN